MLWYIAIVATVTLVLAIVIYRRQENLSNDAAILEAAATIRQLTGRLTGTGAQIQQATDTLTDIEPGEPTS